MKKILVLASTSILLFASCSSNSHSSEVVDLGLSVKWASANLGAKTQEDRGDYYAWGEIIDKMEYSGKSYSMFVDGDSTKITKYCPEDKLGFWYGGSDTPDNLLVLQSEDDVARTVLGGKWRIPTDEEWAELFLNCTWIWSEINGVKGYTITSNINGNHIFLPAVGWKEDYSLSFEGFWGYYWSSTVFNINPGLAHCITINEFRNGTARGAVFRYYGLSIRPVTE